MTPMAREVTLVPGETYHGTMQVSVPSDATEDFNYIISVMPYTINNDTYEARFDKETDYTTIVDWVKVEEPEGTLKPNEIRQIKFSVDVPKDTPGGGQYFALLIRDNDKAEAEEDGLSINNTFELASIVYAKVDGDVSHETEIQANSVPGFSFEPKIDTSAVLRNNGNIHEQAIIELSVANRFTGEVVYPSNADQMGASEMVMPGTTRYYTRGIEGLPMMGVFDVKQTVYYGDNYDTMEGTLIVCPIWFMFLVLAVISLVITSIVVRVRRHKKKIVV